MSFTQKEITEEMLGKMITSNVWNHDCPVKITDLALLGISYIDFAGHQKEGEMLVHKSVKDATLSIFEELYQINFPIHNMETIEKFDGDDDKSMAANNSSCFNFRKIAGTDRFSIHSYGLAIDINPKQNPCISEGKIYPEAGTDYLNREIQKPGMVEPIVDIFKRNGFETWGGEWTEPVDYHHFQVSKEFLSKL